MTHFVSLPLIVLILAAVPVQDRSPEPDAAVQKEKLKAVRDIFREEYAKKAASDQLALARQLLNRGVETQDDPSARYVMFKEAREIAAGLGDLETAFRAADETAKSFAVAAPPLKLAALTRAGAASKDPELARGLARAALALVAEAVHADDYETATGALTRAESFGKAAQDAPVAARIQELQKDLPSLKSEYQKVKATLEKPDGPDVEAAGRYLCLVRGDWESGLAFLVSGSKPPLKTLAEKDAAKPTEADKQLEIADGWWDLSLKEKSPWRKSRLASRAQFWFEQASANASGLTKVKVDKRLAEIEESQPGSVNLLRLIDVKQDPLGDWALDGGALLSAPPPTDPARVMIPYAPPDEYDLTAVLERRVGTDAIVFGLCRGSTQFAVWIDGYSNKGGRSGIEVIDGVGFDKNPTVGALLTSNKPSTVVISVRKTGVTASIDGKTFVTFQGATTRLGAALAYWKVTNWKGLYLGSCGTQYRISKLVLTAVSGQGKKLR